MPEVQPRTDLVPHRQCEIRRPSPLSVRSVNGVDLHFAAGYFYDIVWVRQGMASKHASILDEDGHEWTIAEVYGTRLMPAPRVSFRKVTP